MLGILFRNDDIRIQFKAKGFEELLHLRSIEGIFVALCIQRHTDCLEENGGEHLSSAVNRNVHDAAKRCFLVVGHELKPCAAARNQFTGIRITAGALF